MGSRRTLALVAGLGALLATRVVAQQNATPIAVGAEAPDFSLTAATKDGVGKTVRLKDFTDKTVVFAFFYKARTKG